MWGKFRSIASRRNSPSADSQSRSLFPANPEIIDGSAVVDAPQETTKALTHRNSLLNYERRLGVVTSHSRRRSQDHGSDPLGLTMLYTPDTTPTADLIFIHGLGGTSRQTWSKNRDPDLFWPQKWLPLEPDICTTRIFSFGYNAHFSSWGPNSVASISDFAKSLLFALKFAKNDDGTDFKIGGLPIVFIAHSMGGLVFKKAYLQGQSNDEYRFIVDQIRGIIFLSTPHRGTHLAEILNRILSVSIFTSHSPKQYLTELNRNSLVIEDLNEIFRNFASKLRIFSFYETLQTSVGPKSMMVLEKDSSVLGYPGEISQPLNADHHDVCKYSSTKDPNYISVRSVLQTMISSFREAREKVHIGMSLAKLQRVESLLGVSEAPLNDLTSFLSRWSPGTCRGILSNVIFQNWLENSSTSSILWAYARPGNGKSVQAAFLIDYLLASGCKCSYFFFRHDDSRKRSASSLLKSLGLQIAKWIPDFEEALSVKYEDGLRLEKMDARSIWQQIFLSILLKIEGIPQLHWVIDGLDESDSISLLIEFFSCIPTSIFPIHIMIFSRETPAIAQAFDRISRVTSLTTLNADRNADDIRLYAMLEMEYMHGTNECRKMIVDEIVDRAEGNFLWVSLVLKEIMQCHSYDEIQQAFDEIPSGMDLLYQRMEASIKGLKRAADKDLARIILIWATYSRRPLNTEELLRALQPQFPVILDLKFTISKVCGQFVMIDSNNCVCLVHLTAREYLVKFSNLWFSISAKDAHEDLFKKSLSSLNDRQIRNIVNQNPLSPFYSYCATSWAYHLNMSSAASDDSFSLLTSFFQGVSVLPWIQILAVSGQLGELILASQVLTSFIEKRRKPDAMNMASLPRLSDLQLLELWAIDLLKLVGKFGSQLLDEPTAIYNNIPQISPHSSALFQQFGGSKASSLCVTGLSDSDWDDCLTKVSVGHDYQAEMITCSGHYLAVTSSEGIIHLWNSSTFEEIWSFVHQEYLFTMCFNTKSDLLASYGCFTTKIWNVTLRCQLFTVTNLDSAIVRPRCMTFTDSDTALMIGSDLQNIRKLSTEHMDQGWQMCDISKSCKETLLDDANISSPTAVAFNTDMTEVAIAYRRSSLTVWSLTNAKFINRCKRGLGLDKTIGSAWTGVNRVLWHPNSGELLGIHTDGAVFKWHPLEETHRELEIVSRPTPSEINCSPNGLVFATSDLYGTINIYNFDHLTLLYQLFSEHRVTTLCFSPDVRRIYDLRGSYCNAWEPSILIRVGSTDELASENDNEAVNTRISYLASEVLEEIRPSITAVSARPHGILLCASTSDGLVELHDATNQRKRLIAESAGGMRIDHLIWGEDSKFIVYSEIGVGVFIKSVVEVDPSTDGFGWHCETVMRFRPSLEHGAISRIFISQDSKFVLVASQSSAQLWSLRTKIVEAVYTSSTPRRSAQWIPHPSKVDQILVFTTSTVTALEWNNLKQAGHWRIDLLLQDSADEETEEYRPVCQSNILPTDQRTLFEAKDKIDPIISTRFSPYILLRKSRFSVHHEKRRPEFHLLDIASLQCAADPNCILDTTPIPATIAATIEHPLNILGKDLLVYIDKSFWICSWRISMQTSTQEQQMKSTRHFFLPRDWINIESVSSCQVLADGTLLCPRKGEVALVKSRLGSGW